MRRADNGRGALSREERRRGGRRASPEGRNRRPRRRRCGVGERDRGSDSGAADRDERGAGRDLVQAPREKPARSEHVEQSRGGAAQARAAPLQRRRHLPSCAHEEGLDCGHGRVHRRGDLGVAQALPFAQEDRLAQVVRQSCERLGQILDRLVLARRPRKQCLVEAVEVARSLDERAPPGRLDPRKADVVRDLVEPARLVPRHDALLEREMHAQERVLSGIGCLLAVAQAAEAVAVDLVPVLLVELRRGDTGRSRSRRGRHLVLVVSKERTQRNLTVESHHRRAGAGSSAAPPMRRVPCTPGLGAQGDNRTDPRGRGGACTGLTHDQRGRSTMAVGW